MLNEDPHKKLTVARELVVTKLRSSNRKRGVAITDRRRKQRFPLARGLRYYTGSVADPSPGGAGHTENISSSGLLFRCAENPEPGSRITLEVDMQENPGGEPLRLYISGHVIRSNSSGVAVQFSHCRFGNGQYTSSKSRTWALRRSPHSRLPQKLFFGEMCFRDRN